MIDLDAFEGFTPGISIKWHSRACGYMLTDKDNNYVGRAYEEVDAKLFAAAPDLLALAREQREEIERLRKIIEGFEREKYEEILACQLRRARGVRRFSESSGPSTTAFDDQFRGEEG